jgi:hypothetical protein
MFLWRGRYIPRRIYQQLIGMETPSGPDGSWRPSYAARGGRPCRGSQRRRRSIPRHSSRRRVAFYRFLPVPSCGLSCPVVINVGAMLPLLLRGPLLSCNADHGITRSEQASLRIVDLALHHDSNSRFFFESPAQWYGIYRMARLPRRPAFLLGQHTARRRLHRLTPSQYDPIKKGHALKRVPLFADSAGWIPISCC